MKLSVVIPAYNAGDRLFRLLASLRKSKYKNFEVIIGDDGSREPVSSCLRKQTPRRATFFQLTVFRLPVNRGPAAARNLAAKKARGQVLVFLDSDVEVYPDTLGNIAKKFVADPDLTALTGVWDKEQKSQDFFPQFKAIRDWSYWTNERDRDGYYYLFSTRIAAIKKEVFVRLGGFNPDFRQMEDVEITYRIARRYAIIFAPEVRVHHEFGGFFEVAQKYFWRSFYWSRLYGERKKFDPVATTMWESLAAVSGVGVVGWAGVFLLSGLGGLSYISKLSLILAVVAGLVHLFLLRKFLAFVYREKGAAFMLKSLYTGLLLYLVIVAGAGYWFLRKNFANWSN